MHALVAHIFSSIARRYELDAMRKCEQPGHAFIGEDWTGEGGGGLASKRVCCVAMTSF